MNIYILMIKAAVIWERRCLAAFLTASPAPVSRGHLGSELSCIFQSSGACGSVASVSRLWLCRPFMTIRVWVSQRGSQPRVSCPVACSMWREAGWQGTQKIQLRREVGWWGPLGVDDVQSNPFPMDRKWSSQLALGLIKDMHVLTSQYQWVLSVMERMVTGKDAKCNHKCP